MSALVEKQVLAHIWQNEGLGLAPFRNVSLWVAPNKSLLETYPCSYNNAMAAKPKCCHFSCDHCGMPITHHYIIKSADNKLFCVGSECVAKTGNAKLISEAKARKNKHNRENAAAKREAKREEQRLAYEAEMEAERARNDGLTDYEVEQANIKQERDNYLGKIADIALPVVSVLENQSGQFAHDMARSISKGGELSPNCKRIVSEILTKQFGRANSKAYNANYDDQEVLVTNTLNAIQELRNGIDRSITNYF
ncbi:MAG: hypothetical protein ACJAS1_000544 [Oleiphilaceae bacterium]|jgi:hypothetical protein